MIHKLLESPGGLLSTFLGLIALHSCIVGIGLIIQPAFLMNLAGFGTDCDRFFPAQGGVFHIAMGICYLIAALNKRKCMITFSIIVKFIATFFLLTYYFTIDSKLIILLSGIGDSIMGLMIFTTLQNYHFSEYEFY